MNGRRGGYWTAVAASTAALIAGIVVAVGGGPAPTGPDDVVRAYFAAVSRADAPAALALADRPGGPSDFLTSEVLALQQHIAPLQDVEIAGVDGTGRTRTVRYSYRLAFPDGARTVTGGVDVVPAGDTWRLSAASVPVHLDLSAAAGRATLAGAAVPDEPVALFPGAVPVRFDTPELAVEHAAVAFGASPDLTLTVTISRTGRASLNAAVAAQLRTCFATTPAPAQCPLPDDPRVVPGSLHGTIDTSGIDDLTYAVELFASGPIRVAGTLPFNGTYDRLDTNNIARTHRGVLSVQVRAVTSSVPPMRLQFVQASS